MGSTLSKRFGKRVMNGIAAFVAGALLPITHFAKLSASNLSSFFVVHAGLIVLTVDMIMNDNVSGRSAMFAISSAGLSMSALVFTMGAQARVNTDPKAYNRIADTNPKDMTAKQGSLLVVLTVMICLSLLSVGCFGSVALRAALDGAKQSTDPSGPRQIEFYWNFETTKLDR